NRVSLRHDSRPFDGARWARARNLSTGSAQIETVGIHHLGPRRHEVLHELLLGVRARVDFREGAKLRVCAEDQVDAGGGPLGGLRLAVATLVHAIGVGGCHSVAMSSRLTKKSLVSFPGCLVKTPCLEPPALAPSTRRPPMRTVISGPVNRSNCARSTNASSGAMNCRLLLV